MYWCKGNKPQILFKELSYLAPNTTLAISSWNSAGIWSSFISSLNISGFRDVRGSLIARLSRENNPEYMTVRVSSVRVSLLIFLNCSGLTGLPSMDDTINCKIFPTVCLSHFDNGLMRMLISGGTRPPKKGVLSEWTLPPEPVTCIIDILACLIAANSVYHIWNCCDKSMDKVNRKICRHNVLQRKVTAKKESWSADRKSVV